MKQKTDPRKTKRANRKSLKGFVLPSDIRMVRYKKRIRIFHKDFYYPRHGGHKWASGSWTEVSENKLDAKRLAEIAEEISIQIFNRKIRIEIYGRDTIETSYNQYGILPEVRYTEFQIEMMKQRREEWRIEKEAWKQGKRRIPLFPVPDESLIPKDWNPKDWNPMPDGLGKYVNDLMNKLKPSENENGQTESN